MTSGGATVQPAVGGAAVVGGDLGQRLARARRELLDLSARNRLLHVPRENPRSGRLDIVKERSDDIYRILVGEARSMTFLGSDGALADDDDPEAAYADDKLQTALAEKVLEKRLLKTYYDAKTFEQEQGANILFLALGFLRWFEADQADTPRHAPLLLIPVQLERRKAGAKFTLRYDDSELSTNASLAEKLREFGLQLPAVPEVDELVPSAYFAAVRSAVAQRGNWEVDENGMVLWFFSFAKFLMYRDLDPNTWPAASALTAKASIQALLHDGFRADPPIVAEEANLDGVFQPRDLVHVLEADSSQTIAIEEVKRGRSLVIQGPPGTGKSQTIANVVAGAVRAGKRVLFVAEKVAALQVVKQRLDATGLGALCLELHSHKSNKLAVLEELRRTLELGPPVAANVSENAEALLQERDRLNTYVTAIHTPLLAAGVTAFEAMGQLLRLQSDGWQALDMRLPQAAGWQRADLRQRQRVLEELAVVAEYVGVPAAHPCRGVRAVALLPPDRQRILEQLRAVLTQLDTLRAQSLQLSQMLEAPPAVTLNQVGELSAALHVLGQAPQLDLRCLASSEWESATQHLRAIVQTGAQLTAQATQLRNIVTDAAWSVDVALTRTHLAAHGRSFFRFFSADYRRARALVRGLCQGDPPPTVESCIELLDSLTTAQRLRAAVAAGHELASRAFGSLWGGEASHWDSLGQLVSWVELANQQDPSGRARRAAARIGSPQAAVSQAAAFGQSVSSVRATLEASLARLDFDCVEAFGVHDVGQVPLDEFGTRLSQWIEAPMILDRWVAYFGASSHLRALDLSSFVPMIASGRLAPATFVPQLTASFYEEVLRSAYERFPALGAFDGATHTKVIDRFQALDRERLRLARYEVCVAHARGLPNRQGDGGEMGVLRKEISKKRRHMPLRHLLKEAGRSIQAIKPLFMMSPISVAQFLEPGGLEFDLLLIDEASQVAPVDALGAIARCKQIVVVGDEKQLPPTSFFQRMATDDDGEEDSLGDVQSILALCVGQGLPDRMLRWHYRSRHHSLIAVSNREFYDGRLFIPPSPEHASDGNGLRFHHVPDGVFDRGNATNNQREAQVVAQHVLKHARETPNKTLGVGAFSMAQRDAVLNEVELLREAHPELETFCSRGGQDEFFVKNLESIQGDERDVIFISVGYGKDSSGFMSMSFGPLNNDGGERRLNVLITRSRERCEVFSSITADDIKLERSNARGVVAFKQFLHYAATGIQDIGVQSDEKGFGSPFEEQVARAVQQHGYAVHSQVGVAGFFIDLAVPDPEQPGRYLAGIECDGAQYHSSRCARDRDRLRQQVLEDRGWTIVRVWSTDWFRDASGQTKKLVEALARARAKPRGALRPVPKPEAPAEVARHAPHSVPPPIPKRVVPYVEATFAVPSSAIHQLSIERLADVVRQVIETEGPIHRDEVAKRVTGLWGLSRTGSRIAGAVEDALHWLASRNRIHAESDFFRMPGRPVVPRDRENASSASLRKAEYLPPSEIRAALHATVRANQGIDEERLLTDALRLLGFKTVGAQVRAAALSQLQTLCRTNALELRDGRFYSTGDA